MNRIINKNISIIVAIAENNAIGDKNKLLWHLSGDLKRFKRLTAGHTVIMGRRTFKSLPKGALPDRRNIVVSDIPGETFPGCETANSIEEALTLCDEKDETFIIGGGLIYRQFLPFAKKLYITKVHKEFQADTYFPEINYDEWNELSREQAPFSGEHEYPHTYIVYERKVK